VRLYYIFEQVFGTRRLDSGLYHYCLRRQPWLLRYFLYRIYYSILHACGAVTDEKYYRTRWRFLASVPKAQLRIAAYWKSRRVSQLSPRPDWGKSLWLSIAPEQVIRPLAEKYGAALIANPFDLLRGTYTAFSDYDALYREAVRHTKPIRVVDGVRHSLTINAEASHAAHGIVFGAPREARRHNIIVACQTFALLLVFGVILGIVALFIASEPVGPELFAEYFGSPLLLLLNFLPGILLLFALYFISNRVWLSFALTSLTVLLPSWINLYKITYRSDTFVPEDIRLFGDTLLIIRELAATPVVLISLLAVGAAVIALAVLVSVRIKRGAYRTVGLILTLCVSIVSVNLYTSDAVAGLVEAPDTGEIVIARKEFISLGFIYPFLRSAHTLSVKPPEDYTEKLGAELISGLAYLDIPENKKVNIIAVMCDSFTDLGSLGAKFDIDPYSGFKALKKKSYAGELIANTFGENGTDSEWGFLTGYPQAENGYRSDAESFVRFLKSQGYYAEGAYPNHGSIDNRAYVSKYLGFDDYHFWENDDKLAGYSDDKTLFTEIAALYSAFKLESDAPYFSFSVTYPNNIPNDEKLYPLPFFKQGEMSDENYIEVNNYLYSLRAVTEGITRLVEFIDSRPEPTVFIMFGGHKPYLGADNSAYEELGITFKGSTRQLDAYKVPYLIHANGAAQLSLGGDFTGSGDTLSPGFLLPKLFELGDMGGSEAFQLARETMAELPVISRNKLYLTAAGKVRTKFSAEDESDAALAKVIKRFEYATYYLRWRKIT
jgi:phosphoglycerol transferase MdoB-like AlkP superfamily enzyme